MEGGREPGDDDATGNSCPGMAYLAPPCSLHVHSRCNTLYHLQQISYGMRYDLYKELTSQEFCIHHLKKGKYFTYGKICCNRKDMCVHTWHVRSSMYIYINHDKSFCSVTSHYQTPQIFLGSLLTVNNSIYGKLKNVL